MAMAAPGPTSSLPAGGLRVLGIDPGSRITGYALIECRSPTTLNSGRNSQATGMSGPLEATPTPDVVLREAGVVRLDGNVPLADRLVTLHEDMTEVMSHLRPNVMAIEKLYAHYGHPITAVKMAHARGIILLAGKIRGVHLVEIASTEVKKAITGNGHATKEQIQHAVQAQCDLNALPTPADVADAIAIGLTVARRLSVRLEIESTA